MIVYLNGEPMAPSAVRTLLPGLEPACVLHRDHGWVRPLRLVAHHVHPLGHGGPDVKANLAVVCDNGHMNVHEILKLLLKGEPLPARRFGTRTERAMARRGYGLIRAACP